jgi:hypothetical protein
MLVASERAQSLVVHGLVRKPSGPDREFRYTRGLRGNPGRTDNVEVRDCAKPRVVSAGDGGADFVCKPSGLAAVRGSN